MLDKIRSFLNSNLLKMSPKKTITQENQNDSDHVRTHLESYLEFYQQLDLPRYAVLVTGAWGIGKTYQVRKCIPEDKCIYVSMFGLQTVEQLHAEVLATAFPTIEKAKKLFSRAEETAKDMGGLYALAGTAPMVLSAMFRQNLQPNRTLIFDDLERSRIKLKDKLGVINSYVEQKGFRVIVIAHDTKISEKFSKLKEKTFGQVIRVSPQVNEALEFFIDEISDVPTKAFIQKYKSEIYEVFKQSGIQTLRVLRHVIEDIGRIYISLDKHLREHQEAMKSLVSMYSALDIEIRIGRLNQDDLLERHNAAFIAAIRREEAGKESEIYTLADANEKYPSVNLASNMLSDGLLVDMLINGKYDNKSIKECIYKSSFFIRPEDDPPWRVVINFDELEDNVVADGLRRMNYQFDNREVIDSGELLQIFSLRLMLTENGVFKHELIEEKELCLSYIDDLLKSNRLPPREPSPTWEESFVRAHGGFTYWITQNTRKYFQEIKDHLITAREYAFRNSYSSIAKELIDAMKENIDKFTDLVTQTNNDVKSYAHVPVLCSIDPTRFVDTWLSLPHAKWNGVRRALVYRYRHGGLINELFDESDWIEAVQNLLTNIAESQAGIDSLRIRRIVPVLN